MLSGNPALGRDPLLRSLPRSFSLFFFALLFPLVAQSDSPNARDPAVTRQILNPTQWRQLDQTVDNGLRFLASRQEADGSFPTLKHAKPGVTSLCVLAFLSRGHLPNEGLYGKQIRKAVDFVASVQRSDGLLTREPLEDGLPSHGVSHAAMYNHGISGLMLSEVYGVTGSTQQDPLHRVIAKALEFSRTKQNRRTQPGVTRGGFDYATRSFCNDLPITSCQLLFFRSARNAGFEVPAQHIDDALLFVKSCYDPRERIFLYRDHHTYSRGVTACGILALSLAGEHQTEIARSAGGWLGTQSFERFNRSPDSHDRYFYSAYYASQAMFQLGGDPWSNFYPPLLDVLAKNQRSDGSWDHELGSDTTRYGNAYSSALAILALTPPYQILPIFQR